MLKEQNENRQIPNALQVLRWRRHSVRDSNKTNRKRTKVSIIQSYHNTVFYSKEICQNSKSVFIAQNQQKKSYTNSIKLIARKNTKNWLVGCNGNSAHIAKLNSQAKKQSIMKAFVSKNRLPIFTANSRAHNKIARSKEKDSDYKHFERINRIEGYLDEICRWCQQKIPLKILNEHRYTCQRKASIEKQLLTYKLSQKEYSAMSQAYRKSAFEHLKVKGWMEEVIFTMGYDEEDLLLMKEYLEHQAPIIIHIDFANSIQHLLNDTHYRNLFETKRSGGLNSITNRKAWETYLFGDAYDGCSDSERVKYGVIDYANDKYIIYKCQKYGSSVIALKNHVRARCTIAHTWAYSKGQIVVTLKYCYSVLSLFKTEQLQTLYMASRGFEVDSRGLKGFKEIHIHWPIKLAEVVECIYTKKKVKMEFRKQIALFQQKFGVKIIEIESLVSNKQ